MSLKTYKIIIGLLLGITVVGSTWLAVKKIKAHREQARVAQAKNVVVERRAAESNAVLAKVEAKQGVDLTFNSTPIDLGPQINASLTTSFVPKAVTDNNLAELGEGAHTLAGVPFRIRGAVQLTGRDLRQYSKASFPREAGHIQVGKTCNQIHILHGSYFIKALGVTIAKFVLHYADGSTHELPIVSGQHVLDWWAPNYETGVRKDWRNVTAPGSELAWVGSNAYIRRKQPHLSLRLFKTTFENPQPGLEIKTIDYVSMDTAAAPFLLGLTVE